MTGNVLPLFPRRRLHRVVLWFSVGWSLSACEERTRQPYRAPEATAPHPTAPTAAPAAPLPRGLVYA